MPAGQAVQLEPEAMAEEYVPAAQGTQPAAFTVPLPVITPAKPGAQKVQKLTLVLLVSAFVVVMPAGQDVQLGASAAEYVPAAQGVHVSEPAAAKVPGAQGAQPAALVVPLPVTVPA
jgi:hypothetical protein